MKSVLLSTLIACLYAVALPAEHFEFKNLGVVSTAPIQLSSMNNNNIVTGFFGENSDRYFFWSEELGFTEIPLTAVKTQSPLINNNDQIAGVYWKKKGGAMFFPDFYIQKEIFIQGVDGSFEEVPFPPKWINRPESRLIVWMNGEQIRSEEINIRDFNDYGDLLVANTSLVTSTSNVNFAVWKNGKYTPLKKEQFERIYSFASDGRIFALQKPQEHQIYSTFVFYDVETDTAQELFPITNISTVASKPNKNNQIAYTKLDRVANTSYGYLWDPEAGERLIGAIAPFNLNSKGQILGTGIKDKNIQYLWDNGKEINLTQELKNLTRHDPWGRITVSKINENGIIFGTGFYKGQVHSFLLVPVSE